MSEKHLSLELGRTYVVLYAICITAFCNFAFLINDVYVRD